MGWTIFSQTNLVTLFQVQKSEAGICGDRQRKRKLGFRDLI
jgi:hypothetical protein